MGDLVCQRCGEEVEDPDELWAVDHDSHCDGCRAECFLCRRLANA